MPRLFVIATAEVSAPVQPDSDVYLLQMIEAELDRTKPFSEVRAVIMERLQEPKAQNAIETYLQSLRIRANIRYMVAKDTILKG